MAILILLDRPQEGIYIGFPDVAILSEPSEVTPLSKVSGKEPFHLYLIPKLFQLLDILRADVFATDGSDTHQCGLFIITQPNMRFKSNIGRGGRCEDIFIENIIMTDIRDEAVVFQCDYMDRPAGRENPEFQQPKKLENVPDFQGIHIKNVTCRGCDTAIRAKGTTEARCVHDIDISNSVFIYNKVSTDIDDATAQIKLTDVRLIENKLAE